MHCVTSPVATYCKHSRIGVLWGLFGEAEGGAKSMSGKKKIILETLGVANVDIARQWGNYS